MCVGIVMSFLILCGFFFSLSLSPSFPKLLCFVFLCKHLLLVVPVFIVDNLVMSQLNVC